MNMLSQASCPSYRGLYGTGRDAEDTTPHLVLYNDQDTRSGCCPAECLAGHTDYLQVDGDAGYHSTEAKRVGCMDHARRQFEEARRVQPNAHVGKVVWALSLIHEEDVYRRRPSASLPLMAAFGQWLSKTVVVPKGYLGKGIGYCQKQWRKTDALPGRRPAQHRQQPR